MRRFYLVLAIMAVAGLAAPRVQADDDQIAQHIYQCLKTEQQNGNLRGYRIDMRVDKGTVWFKGYVSSPEHEMLILRTAQQAGRMGVVQVVDDIDIQQQTASAMPAMPTTPAMHSIREESMGQEPALPVSYSQQINESAVDQAMIPTGPSQTIPTSPPQAGPTALSQQPVNVGTGSPLPVAYAGGMGVTTDNPQLPGYAWPAYAAHPNYAAVSYPRQYSASAWPYIGPFYPYPQVPLGWRSVTLEWDDGWWYLDFNDRGCCGH